MGDHKLKINRYFLYPVPFDRLSTQEQSFVNLTEHYKQLLQYIKLNKANFFDYITYSEMAFTVTVLGLGIRMLYSIVK